MDALSHVCRALAPLLIASLLATRLPAQEQEQEPRRGQRSESRSLDLTVGDAGLSIGNSARLKGLRINWSDRGVEQVDGVNLTLWRPRENPDFIMNGLALGLVSPGASDGAPVSWRSLTRVSSPAATRFARRRRVRSSGIRISSYAWLIVSLRTDTSSRISGGASASRRRFST